MVLVELFFHLLQVKIFLSIGVPWQVEHVVKIGILHRVVRGLWVKAFQFAQFLFKLPLHALVPLHLAAALLQFLDVIDIGAQFLLDGANLLLQEMVALLL